MPYNAFYLLNIKKNWNHYIYIILNNLLIEYLLAIILQNSVSYTDTKK